MITQIYMVRHADSPFSLDEEETRGLSEKGWRDAEKITEILLSERVEAFVSSSYARAIQTVEGAAKTLGLEIALDSRFRERDLAARDTFFEDFEMAIQKVFADTEYAYPGGESNRVARERGVAGLQDILDTYRGKRVAIGTHGNIMTIIMNHYDPAYDFYFWKQTTKPDIYRLTFEENDLQQVTRLWND